MMPVFFLQYIFNTARLISVCTTGIIISAGVLIDLMPTCILTSIIMSQD